MKLFHVTTFKNYKKIKKNGLIPMIGENSKKMKEPIPAIYFFKNLIDVQDALSSWMSDFFPEEDRLIVLEVKLKDESIVKESDAGYEVMVFEKISKNLIFPKKVSWI